LARQYHPSGAADRSRVTQELNHVEISQALSTERQQLGRELLSAALNEPTKTSPLAELLVPDDTLSELAVLKQDVRDFGWHQMAQGTRQALPASFRPTGRRWHSSIDNPLGASAAIATALGAEHRAAHAGI
jgi:hypothetical protein